MTERSWFGSGLSDAARDSGSWKDHRPEPSRLSIGREVRLCPGGPSPITVLRSWQSPDVALRVAAGSLLDTRAPGFSLVVPCRTALSPGTAELQPR
jgi:hypothetical protein